VKPENFDVMPHARGKVKTVKIKKIVERFVAVNKYR